MKKVVSLVCFLHFGVMGKVLEPIPAAYGQGSRINTSWQESFGGFGTLPMGTLAVL